MVYMTNRWWSFHTDFNQSKKIALIATMSDWIKLMLHDSFNQIWAKIYHWFLWHFQTLTLIRVSEEKEEGQGLREFKNLGNYFSVPTAANLWNYFSRHEQHHKRERNQIRRFFASNTFIFNMLQLRQFMHILCSHAANENKFISLIQIYHGFNFLRRWFTLVKSVVKIIVFRRKYGSLLCKISKLIVWRRKYGADI